MCSRHPHNDPSCTVVTQHHPSCTVVTLTTTLSQLMHCTLSSSPAYSGLVVNTTITCMPKSPCTIPWTCFHLSYTPLHMHTDTAFYNAVIQRTISPTSGTETRSPPLPVQHPGPVLLLARFLCVPTSIPRRAQCTDIENNHAKP